jgi:hypothetical protein
VYLTTLCAVSRQLARKQSVLPPEPASESRRARVGISKLIPHGRGDLLLKIREAHPVMPEREETERKRLRHAGTPVSDLPTQQKRI